MAFLIIAILLIFLFDFTKMRNQNQTIIKQNERVISLLEEIKNKKSAVLNLTGEIRELLWHIFVLWNYRGRLEKEGNLT